MRTWIVLLFLSAGISQAQVVGNQFPDMEASTADDRKVKLPQDVADKYTVLALTCSKKSEDELGSWFEALASKFVQDPDGGLWDLTYDVNFYFVPMLTGLNSAAASSAKKRSLKQVDSQLLPHLIFYQGDLKPYRDALGILEKDIPYFYVLDASGKIVYVTSGGYTESKMEKLEEAIQ